MHEKNSQVIREIIRRVQITPERMILLDGKPATPQFENAYTTQPSHKMLFDMLVSVLYNTFYCGNAVNEMKTEEQESNYQETRAYVAALSQANRSTEGFDGGWAIDHIDMQGQITARKANYIRLVYPGEFVNESGFNRKPGQHETIRLFSRKEHDDLTGGFYYVFGDHVAEDNHDQLARIYFNVHAQGSTLLVSEITTHLNLYQVPFTFKCLNHPSAFTRRDTAVLYFEKRYSPVLFRLLKRIHEKLAPHLQEDTPLFTKKLGRGIAFAENPVKMEESFGTHCCKMITQGLLAARNKQLSREKWWQEVKHTIEKIHHYPDWEQLFLNPGSRYPYLFPLLNTV